MQIEIQSIVQLSQSNARPVSILHCNPIFDAAVNLNQMTSRPSILNLPSLPSIAKDIIAFYSAWTLRIQLMFSDLVQTFQWFIYAQHRRGYFS